MASTAASRRKMTTRQFRNKDNLKSEISDSKWGDSMNSFAVRIICSVSLVLGLSLAVLGQQGQAAQTTLTNAAIVKLTKAGFKEKTIISIIGSRIPNFDLSPDRMIELKRNGVSEKVIVAMLARQEGLDMLDDESWGDEEFMSRSSDPQVRSGNGSTTAPPSDGGTNIFGSGSGVKGRSRTQGRDGSVDTDTVTTGSATVRIIKPPTEAGGAPSSAKLEKTKSLTNDSIIELVEAGFSEGTIIRRIEQSPVEFDLAADKLEALRKRRVSDKVLAAMKAAMGEDK